MSKMKNIFIKAFLILSMALIFSGCSSVKYYPNTQDKNMLVKIKTESGSMFSGVKSYLHIYTLKSDCSIKKHLGVVELPEPETEVGISTGKPLQIEIAFEVGGGFFSSGSSVTRTSANIKPRAGYFYEADASYNDGIYDLEIFEKKSRNSKGKLLKELQSCK
jgi:hypothetical protein